MLQKYLPSAGNPTPNRSSRLPGWLKWLLGAVTLLAGSVLILAVLLGVRAGQQQLEIQGRQQIGIYLQQALDHRAVGESEAALEAYRRVLRLDPSNVAAAEGIEAVLGGGTVEQEGVAEQAAAPAEPAPTATSDPLTEQWALAQQAHDEGRWQDAAEQLQEIQRTDPEYRADYLTAMLYNSYFNLAVESDRINRSEEALDYLDKAIALQPTATEARVMRTVITSYMDLLAASNASDADPEALVTALQELYRLDSSYRDVRERLQRAHMEYGDALVQSENWCNAVQQYDSAIAIQVTPGVISKRDAYHTLCIEGGGSVEDAADGSTSSRTVAAASGEEDELAADDETDDGADDTAAEDEDDGTSAAADSAELDEADAEDESAATQAAPAAVPGAPASGSPSDGRILYSARDLGDNRWRVFAQPVGSSASPTMLIEDATQPAMRNDGQRLAYRNMQSDAIGINSFDPPTGLRLRFTQFGEDSLPSWSADGNRVAFASNREGDRLWRIYTVWAEENGATQSFSFGESPEWHPSADRMVFRGCDEQGNGCGLWTMNGNGGERTQVTNVPADTHPTWSPDGRYILFTSNARHGNWDIYRVSAADGSVVRLTEHGANDVLPTASPDGNWVAFLSTRSGQWELWAVPMSGGEAQLIAPVVGDIGSWVEQNVQWIR